MSDLDDLVLARISGDGNNQPAIIAANVVTLVGAIATIILRFLSRRISQTKYSWDDWLVFPALLFALIYFGNLCGSLSYGFGQYIGDVTFPRLRQAFIGIFVGELTYAYSLACTKFSFLALYLRIFDQGWSRKCCYVLAVINGLWIIACTVLSCLQCQPTRGFWDRELFPKCDLDIRATFLGLGIITIVTDIALVALPTYICWRLSLSNTKKWLLSGVFVTGLFVTVASGIRLKAILDLNTNQNDTAAFNITWTFSDTALWSGVEVNMAIVSSCLPVLRPLVAKAIPIGLVPTSLRKPSQPTSYYGLESSSRKASQSAAVRMEERSKRSKATSPDVEAQQGVLALRVSPTGDRTSLIHSAAQRTRSDTPERPPTPPPKEKEKEKAVMRAAMTRPPSWNMEVAYAEGLGVRHEKGSSDTPALPSPATNSP